MSLKLWKTSSLINFISVMCTIVYLFVLFVFGNGKWCFTNWYCVLISVACLKLGEIKNSIQVTKVWSRPWINYFELKTEFEYALLYIGHNNLYLTIYNWCYASLRSNATARLDCFLEISKKEKRKSISEFLLHSHTKYSCVYISKVYMLCRVLYRFFP